ncbi:MAG: TIGR03086 family metal-binding protein [Acidimicrobiales bacterium]
MDPIDMYRRATDGAIAVMRAVAPEQLELPTPCAEWSVQNLIDHMTGSTAYLRASLAGQPPSPLSGTSATDFSDGADAAASALMEPGALERVCMSPLGFEWTIGHAVMGTIMDTVIHTWDLATATGQSVELDPGLVEMCIAMFLPEMPERGRESGLVGAVVAVPEDATADVRLLGAMGRRV